jgi:hypothetical protein
MDDQFGFDLSGGNEGHSVSTCLLQYDHCLAVKCDVMMEMLILQLPQSKKNESRVLSLVGNLESLIEKRWEERQGDYIFHQGDGRPVGRIEHNWRTACERAGMPDKLFHDLRRSAVRNAIESGLSERHTMALCGHKTNHMLHRYHIVVERDLREAMLAMVRPKNVSPFRDVREPSSQLPENIERKRIGAGVPPGLQIQ